jgi:hypothetical protein
VIRRVKKISAASAATVLLASMFVLWFHFPVFAETKWSRFTSGLNICPNPENVNDSGCPRSKPGPITITRTLQDRLGRTVYEVAHSGGSGFISDYQFQYDMISEDPAITKQKAQARASKAAAAANAAKEAAAEKAKKQDEQDAATIAAAPRGDLEKDCILTAAERLPRIPGIQILASRVAAMPEGIKTNPSVYQSIVHIDAKAAGVETTYNFICTRGVRTPSLVVRF